MDLTRNHQYSCSGMQEALHGMHVEAPIKTFCDVTYVRISVHVYNTLDDYRLLADAMMSLLGS